LSPEQLLGSAEVGDTVVIADLEAGLGTLTRLREGLDAVVVVVEPTAKAIDVGLRAAAMTADKDLGPVHVVANRVRDDADVERVRAAFAGTDVLIVPYDPAVAAADRDGRSPVDSVPTSPAVTALAGLPLRLGLLG
jgi:CO dehydrogenase maturation factor